MASMSAPWAEARERLAECERRAWDSGQTMVMAVDLRLAISLADRVEALEAGIARLRPTVTVEEVARVIDPTAFVRMSKTGAYAITLDVRRKQACAKASKILALLSPEEKHHGE